MSHTYTVKEAARLLGYSTNSIYAFLKEKRIKGVRIGRGRFRIPEEELTRILNLLHADKPTAAHSPLVPTVRNDEPPADDAPRAQPPRVGALLPPDIFDWFIGIGAVISGVALFLFNAAFGVADGDKTMLIFPVVRMVLIFGGAGVILTGFSYQGKGWRTVFYTMLALLGSVNAYGLVRSGDVEGGLLYGMLAVAIAAQQFFQLSGVVSVLTYATLIALAYPLVFLFVPRDIHAQVFLASLGWSHQAAGLAGLAVSAALVAGVWVGYAGRRGVFILVTTAMALCDILVAIWYAHMQYWSRAFFIIVVGYFTGVAPYWQSIRRNVPRRFIFLLHAFFAGVGMALLIAVLVVSLLQRNIWDARERELLSKLHLAQSRIENVITSVTGSLVVASNNPEFVGIMVRKDVEKLSAFAKIIYESNPNIRRLVFLDKRGDGIALYPYGTFDDPNYAYREYFQQAKNTGKPFISGVFQARVDQSGRYVIAISVPLRDAKGVFAGVVAASLDLDRLGVLLEQVTTPEREERFVVVDSKGVVLLHPTASLIGTPAPATDPVLSGVQGKEGVTDGLMLSDQVPGMVAYAGVPSLQWGVSLRVPSRNVFALTSFAIWAVFGMVGFVLVISSGIFFLLQQRIRSDNGDG